MARLPRLLVTDAPTVYHVISRTALDGLPFDAVDKDDFVTRLKSLAQVYFTEILGYCVMDNHFHILMRMFPAEHVAEEDLRRRFRVRYGEKRVFPAGSGKSDDLRKKWSSLSEFSKELKESFSKAYNRRNGRRGYLWGDRFKSLVVEDGDALLNCLAYIDLNPVRAKIVSRPEEYRWCSLGYHVQSGNRGDFLSLDFGHGDMGEDASERFRCYREFVYETGAVDTGKGASLDGDVVSRERKREFVLGDMELFRYRCRYFSDSGVIGSRAYVERVGRVLQEKVPKRKERPPHSFKGVTGLCTLKRLAPG
ncbi:MAG TPA: transposase [Desulfomicrobiaceae bacterium]|nr:transposase [Desulfomicrobiaceae bacterium]